MDVRIVRADEWEAFRELRLRALEDAPDAFGGTHATAVEEPESYWHGWITGDGWDGVVRSWVADDRGRFRGMAVGARFDDEPATLNLFGMWVAPEGRGSGIARRLVDMVEAWGLALGVERLVLRVSDGNARAEAFYAKLGFRRTPRPSLRLRDSSTVRVHEMARPLAPAPSPARSAEGTGDP